jgi:lysophospholipase L1-like esterase
MHSNGVKQVLWQTLRPVYQQYRITNEVIRGTSGKFPWMKVVNWAGYSWPHPSWFGPDGIHFNGGGAVQFAEYLHRTLKSFGLTGPISSQSG